MSSLFQDIGAQIERAIEQDRGCVVIHNLRLGVRLYYYVMKYGLRAHELNQHQVREYIKKLIEKDCEEWCQRNHKTIFLNANNKIIEQDLK